MWVADVRAMVASIRRWRSHSSSASTLATRKPSLAERNSSPAAHEASRSANDALNSGPVQRRVRRDARA
jgi:hypothetical protein